VYTLSVRDFGGKNRQIVPETVFFFIGTLCTLKNLVRVREELENIIKMYFSQKWIKIKNRAPIEVTRDLSVRSGHWLFWRTFTLDEKMR